MKSTRCGECGLPIKGHKRRGKGSGKACVVVLKIRKNGAKRPKLKSFDGVA